MIFKDCYWGSLTLIPVAHYMPWNKNNIFIMRCKGTNTFFNQNLHQCFRFINFCIKATWYNLQHYHLEVQANTPKNGTKKMLFLASMKKQDYPITFLLTSHLGFWNDDLCWILRLRPWNFAIVPEKLAPHLKKVR